MPLTRRACVTVMASLLVAGPAGRTGDAQPAPLTGYLELTVEVEGLPQSAHEAGIERSNLKERLARVLRGAGVRVLTRDDRPETVGPVPTLVLRLHMLKTASHDGVVFTHHLRLSCTRPATTREHQREVTGVLWERESMDVAARPLVHSDVNDNLGSLLEAFLNDWRAANPREP